MKPSNHPLPPGILQQFSNQFVQLYLQLHTPVYPEWLHLGAHLRNKQSGCDNLKALIMIAILDPVTSVKNLPKTANKLGSLEARWCIKPADRSIHQNTYLFQDSQGHSVRTQQSHNHGLSSLGLHHLASRSCLKVLAPLHARVNINISTP